MRKNDNKDYHFELTKLIDVTINSLESGSKDPNTAVDTITRIGILLGKLFSNQNFYQVLKENESSQVIYKSYSDREELYLSYNQILH